MKILNWGVVLLLYFLLSGSSLKANHLIGGELSYECLGENNYQVNLTIYRDCDADNAADFDDPAIVFVYDSFGAVIDVMYMEYKEDNSGLVTPNLENVCDSFLPQNTCIQFTVYSNMLSINPDIGDITLVYQRCCRNNGVLNVANSSETGSTYEIFIPRENENCDNSSPVFNNEPPAIICRGLLFEFDFSANDLDGDDLVYSLCTPFDGADQMDPHPGASGQSPEPHPYNPIVWANGYDENNQLGFDSSIRIDAESGVLTVFPENFGLFTIGVCVSEFRNGVLLSTSIRDLQFNVLPCQTISDIDDETNYFVGGELSYECRGQTLGGTNNLYEVKLTLYRSCNPDAQPCNNEFEDQARIIVIDSLASFSFPLEFESANTIHLKASLDDVCEDLLPNSACIEYQVYTDVIELPVSFEEGTLFHHIPLKSRYNFIANISNPGEKNWLFKVNLSSEGENCVNSSPVFNSEPPLIVCEGVQHEFDFSASDLDGDDLEYSLCTPVTADGMSFFGVPVIWADGFDENNQLGPDSTFEIDEDTGLLTVTAQNIGLYTIGVCVSEFRNGQLLSTNLRDYQLNVLSCDSLMATAEEPCEDENVLSSVTLVGASKPPTVYPTIVQDLLFTKEEVANTGLRVFDLQGRVVFDQSAVAWPINLSGLSSGVYLVELNIESQRSMHKIYKRE